MATYMREGDRLRGDVITCSYRKGIRPRVNQKTNQHKGEYVILKGNVVCTIETPLRVNLKDSEK